MLEPASARISVVQKPPSLSCVVSPLPGARCLSWRAAKLVSSALPLPSLRGGATRLTREQGAGRGGDVGLPHQAFAYQES